jgi:rhamnose utilization protein RhaD (predicted bifunctional aldolase and dehydrogenase)/NAD(P)-dependent dehydrogenase (short-subunit alcohol dehydrogenase family)
VRSKWSESEARSFVARYKKQGCKRELALRVYSSRLIGRDPALVLHGGGNTSLKTRLREETGRQADVLLVKASGQDLQAIEPGGFSALRLRPLRQLRASPALSDEQLADALRPGMLDARGPRPSVEALLHAFLPHRYIDHSHADAVLALLDQRSAAKLCREAFGKRLAVVPFFMSGFALARAAIEVYQADPGVEGLLLIQHGLVTFGETARESYERHIRAVDLAERFLAGRRRRPASRAARPRKGADWALSGPILRGKLGSKDGRYVLELRQGERIGDFVNSPDLASLSQRGPVTPDHVVRTKRLPLVLNLSGAGSEEEIRERVEDALAAYREEYLEYVERNRSHDTSPAITLDPDPRVILVPGLGLIAAGSTLREARIAADIYQHSIEVMLKAEAVGKYRPVSEANAFRYEYWSLEQAKLGGGARGALSGSAVYVTGAASGIGEATARLFAQEGANLYLVDRDQERLQAVAEQLDCPWQKLDVSDERAVRASVNRAVNVYGGLDGAVSNAGYAPQSPIDTCDSALLRKSFEVNFFAHQFVAAAVSAVLRRQGNGGFLLFNVSKAAFNPGEGFGPYALPKAAQMALMKQYALEGGKYGIRSNAVNADRIRTGLFSINLIEERARARGLKADDYFRSNLLGREVTAGDVARAFLALALAEATTGCTITVDGGNIAASPR